MKKFFDWIKKHWKQLLVGLAVIGAAIWGVIKIFFSGNDRTDFVKDPANPNKIIVKDPKTGESIGVKLPDGMNNGKVKTVSKPVDIQTKPVEVNNNTVDRKETPDAKTDITDIPNPASAADWLGTNNPNFKG
jgi:hypothetical protein